MPTVLWNLVSPVRIRQYITESYVADSSREASPRLSHADITENTTLHIISKSVKEPTQLYTFPASKPETKNNGYTLAETQLSNNHQTSISTVSYQYTYTLNGVHKIGLNKFIWFSKSDFLTNTMPDGWWYYSKLLIFPYAKAKILQKLFIIVLKVLWLLLSKSPMIVFI